MPSFDVSSKVNWQEIDNAIQQVLKEVGTRFDFKAIRCELVVDQKESLLTMTCSEPTKLDALRDVLHNKLIKRGVSILSFDFQEPQAATGSSVRQIAKVQSGISKEKGKEIVDVIKKTKLKVQAQIQDEQVRVTGKSRDELQDIMAVLREKQSQLQLPMQFGNFRD